MKKLLEVMKADKWMTAIVIVTLVIVILGWSGMLCLGRVQGNSMMPSFLDGDYIILSKWVTPKDKDVIILDTSKIPGFEHDVPEIIKRYYADKSTDGYYVLGDNTDASYDSRYFGETPKDAFVGVVLFKFRMYHFGNR